MLKLTGVELVVILATAVVQMYCIKSLLENKQIIWLFDITFWRVDFLIFRGLFLKKISHSAGRRRSIV